MARVNLSACGLKCAVAAPAVLAVGTGLQALVAATGPAPASAAARGVLLDYAAGVIKASDIRAAGAQGAIRYVSDRRPGGVWMRGKPIQLPEARDRYQNGLKIVSCYQYGKQDTADWLGGQDAGVAHANRGWQLHLAAGGSNGAPIYASIDDDPSYEQCKQHVAPYLRGWESVLGKHRVGAYANSKTIEWALQDGLGAYYWQHNWGSPGKAAHLHQVEIDKRSVGGGSRCQPYSQAELRPVGLKPYRSVSTFSKLNLVARAVERTPGGQLSGRPHRDAASKTHRKFLYNDSITILP